MKIPEQMMLNTINVCELQCNNCYLNEFTMSANIMNFSTFKKIVDKLDSVKHIHLTPLVGEPTLHRDIIKQLKYLKERNFEVSMFTNLLNFSEKFLEFNNLNLIISIYGDNEYSYNNFTNTLCYWERFENNFDLVYTNVECFKSVEFFIRNDLNLVSKLNMKMKTLTNVKPMNYDTHTGTHIIENLWNGNWCGEYANIVNQRIDKKIKGICTYALINNSVDSAGDIILCGACDIKKTTKLGNIFNEDLKEIYSDIGKYSKILKNFNMGIYENTCCKKCSEFHQ